MCDCVNVEMGSYGNQVTLKAPSWSGKDTICVDVCLKDEVLDLWRRGIKTTGCCCGHNKAPPYIGVYDDDIQKMKGMGYWVHFNPCRPGDEDAFIPKSVPVYGSSKLLRVRFRANEDDYRPINFPVKHPYWCTGYGIGFSVVVSYADSEAYIYENWPEAQGLDIEEVEGYLFTERFPKPEWFEEE